MDRLTLRLRTIAIVSLAAVCVTTSHALFVGVSAEPASAVGEEVEITLSDGRDEVLRGDTVTYIIRLRSRDNALRNVDVTFDVPEEATIVATDGGNRVGNQIVWNNVILYPDVVRTISVNVTIRPSIDAGVTMIAAARVLGISAIDRTRIVADRVDLPELRISVSDGKEFAEPNQELAYVIRVTNPSDRDRPYVLRTQLPPLLDLIRASGNVRVDNRMVEWPSEFLRAGETKDYQLLARVERDIPDNTAVRLRAYIENVIDTDTTTILTGNLPNAVSISVADGRNAANPGDEITYVVTLENNTATLATEVDVNAALPNYTEFVSATEGGQWTGKAVRWDNMTVSPRGRRTLRFTLRVRSDAPGGAEISLDAEALGRHAVDKTLVSLERIAGQFPRRSSQILLSKTADRQEVRPGDTVTYTIAIRNTLDRVINNLRVEDRMDWRYMQVIGGQGGTLQDGRLLWDVPSLQPGEEWAVRYVVRVSPNAPHGAELSNVVSVSGEGMESVSLTERVVTGRIGIITALPPSGGTFDAIFLALTSLAGAAQVLWQRRKMILA